MPTHPHFDSDVAALRSRITSLEGEVSSLRSKERDLESKERDLERKVSGLESKLFYSSLDLDSQKSNLQLLVFAIVSGAVIVLSFLSKA